MREEDEEGTTLCGLEPFFDPNQTWIASRWKSHDREIGTAAIPESLLLVQTWVETVKF